MKIVLTSLLCLMSLLYFKTQSKYEKLELSHEELIADREILYNININKNLKIYRLYGELDACRQSLRGVIQ